MRIGRLHSLAVGYALVTGARHIHKQRCLSGLSLECEQINKCSISPVIVHGAGKISATGTRTWVARVTAEYPNQLDYSGHVM